MNGIWNESEAMSRTSMISHTSCRPPTTRSNVISRDSL